MKYLKGYPVQRGPLVMPNATKEQKDEMRKKGLKVADISEAEAERIKRDIANR